MRRLDRCTRKIGEKIPSAAWEKKGNGIKAKGPWTEAGFQCRLYNSFPLTSSPWRVLTYLVPQSSGPRCQPLLHETDQLELEGEKFRVGSPFGRGIGMGNAVPCDFSRPNSVSGQRGLFADIFSALPPTCPPGSLLRANPGGVSAV